MHTHPTNEEMTLPPLLVSLAKLNIDAPTKRKPSSSHFGERSDSAQMAVRLIALSRVLLTKDADVLATVAASVNGAELMRRLMAATLRLAVLAAAGDAAASTALNLGNMATMFNVTGSTIARQESYEALFGLPDRVTWNDARATRGRSTRRCSTPSPTRERPPRGRRWRRCSCPMRRKMTRLLRR